MNTIEHLFALYLAKIEYPEYEGAPLRVMYSTTALNEWFTIQAKLQITFNSRVAGFGMELIELDMLAAVDDRRGNQN